MSAAHLFEDFGTLKPAKAPAPSRGDEEIEDLKLEAFENGYQAGWDDAVKAQADTLTHVSSGLAASLQAASFEYHELRASLNGSVQSILEQVVDTVLPTIAKVSLGAHIREQITSMSREALDRPIEIAIAPEAEDAVRGILAGEVQSPFILIVDPLMSPAQVVLRLGEAETELNLDKVVTDIRSAVTAYFQTQTSEVPDDRPA
ncbi:hypothetical protein [Tateyamaria sp. SN3-11]|uniref:hypothetical protein n=1 Tax=Tateyamaria sp. SN3-11 TaxID=3092147 RepID=UPI0039ED9986